MFLGHNVIINVDTATMKRTIDGKEVDKKFQNKIYEEGDNERRVGSVADVRINEQDFILEQFLRRLVISYQEIPTFERASAILGELFELFPKLLLDRKSVEDFCLFEAVSVLVNVCDPLVINRRDPASLNCLLHFLCLLNAPSLVFILLRNPACDVEARNGNLLTPLSLVASTHQSPEIAAELLKRGANPWQRNEFDLCSFDYAAKSANKSFLELLLEHVDPRNRRIPVGLLECATEYSEKDLASIDSSDPRFELIQSLLTGKYSFNIDEVTKCGDTFQMICCRKSLARLVFLTIELRADCEIANYKDETALTLSKDKDWWPVISKPSYDKLFQAINRNDLNEITRLVKVGVDLNRCNGNGEFALVVAIQVSSNETVALMIQSCGAEVNFAFNTSHGVVGMTPLLFAATWGYAGKLSLLLDAGALIDVRTSAGDTMLHLMAREGHIEALKVGVYKALNKNAPLLMDLVNSVNVDNMTPVMVAAANKHRDCVDFLSAAGSEAREAFLSPLLLVHRPPLHNSVVEVLPESSAVSVESGESHAATITTAATAGAATVVVSPPVEEAVAKMLKRTPLELTYHACKFGMTEIVRRRLQNELIVSQINQNVMDTNYVMIKDALTEVITAEPCLYVSCYYGHLQIVTDLLEKGANANSCARNGWSCLFVASKKNYLEIVKLLLLRGANVLAKNRNDMTSINIAAYHGNLEVVRVLLQYKADVNSGDKLGARPLHAAIQSGRCDICEMLLDFGADVNAVTSSGVCGLYVASYSGNEQIVELLLSYKPPAAFASQLKCVDIDAMNKEGLTPLIVAAFNGHVHVMKRLLAAGADLNKTEKKKVTAIYAACQNGHVEAVKLLIDAGADPNIPIGNGNTCIHACAIENKHDIIALLAQQWAKIDEVNVDGVTPLYLACEKGHMESVAMLIGMGANVNVMTKNSVSPINISSQNGHAAVVKKLIESGAFVDSQSSNGTTPLYMAAQNGHTEVCRLLLEAGADVDIRSKDKETAVFVSGYFGHTQIVKLLIDYRVQINIVDRDTRTPLWWACKAGREDVVKLLMDAGADVNISDREHVTPTMVAAKERHSRVCELLSGARVQATLCAICLTNQRCVLFLPCKHLASCADCWLKLERTQSRKCPLCRIDISDVVTVYT